MLAVAIVSLIVAIVAGMGTLFLICGFFIDEEPWLLLVAIPLLFLTTGMGVLSWDSGNKYEEEKCKTKASDLGFKHKYHYSTGCRYVLPDGRVVPDDKYRIID